MREILFRGKRIDNSEWVEGDLSYHVHDGEVYVFPSNGYDSQDCYKVDPETVCQYTGLKDRNGRKIFEGDVIAIPGSNKKGLPAEVRYMERDGSFRMERIGYIPISLDGVQYWGEIIGNVIDNPELIECRRRRLKITQGT